LLTQNSYCLTEVIVPPTLISFLTTLLNYPLMFLHYLLTFINYLLRLLSFSTTLVIVCGTEVRFYPSQILIETTFKLKQVKPTAMNTEKITREQAAEMRLLPFGKKHPVRALIESLKPGELLHVSRSDFHWKRHTPNFFCRQISKSGKKKFAVLKKVDLSGWVIERLA
jgi:hypothetical protein